MTITCYYLTSDPVSDRSTKPLCDSADAVGETRSLACRCGPSGFACREQQGGLVERESALGCCEFHFEQDSRMHLGIQLADIVAHTCSTMLLETLGEVTKKAVLDMLGDSVYDGLGVELGFEMWAGIRYAFLAKNKQNPIGEFDLANVDVYPWGLFIDDSAGERISIAAMERFGENYLCCIH